MVIEATQHDWPGWAAFFITSERGPCYLLRAERNELARWVQRGKSIAEFFEVPHV